MLLAFTLIALLDWYCEDKETTRKSIKWFIIFMGLDHLWVYQIGPLVRWIVEIWRKGAI
jgi:hypothetical protein